MTHYESLYEVAVDNYGIVTAADAQELGISYKEMSVLTSRGMIERLGYGVYKLVRWVSTANDRFAEAVALVGEGAYLWGEAVLAMHGLALVNPGVITVATPRRVRRSLPAWVKIVPGFGGTVTSYAGIPSQSVPDALRSCQGRVMRDRLVDAARDAWKEGLISRSEMDELVEEIGHGHAKETEQQEKPR